MLPGKYWLFCSGLNGLILQSSANTVQYDNMLFYTSLQWLGQNMNVSLNPQKTPHISQVTLYTTLPNCTQPSSTSPSNTQPRGSVVCWFGCVQFAQTAMKVGPMLVLSSQRWANVSPTYRYIAVWLDRLWRGLQIQVTHTTEPAHHRAAGLCAARWCAAKLCAIGLGCVEGHPCILP